MAVSDADLDVLLESARVRGADHLAVEALPAGTLRHGGTVTSMLLLESDRIVSIAGLVGFAGTAERSGGGDAKLGVSGACGYGWRPTGHRVRIDPCAAAEVVRSVPADQPTPVWVTLYARTEAGPVMTGTYDLTVPLDGAGTTRLDLTYRIVEAGRATLPPWPAERAPMAITFEPSDEGWWELRVRIEDGYGRVVDERDLAGYQDDKPLDLESTAVFTVDVPRKLPLRTVLLRREGGTWTPCQTATNIVTADRRWPTALLADACLAR